MAGANVPKLRFPEFSGDWHSKQLSDVASSYNKNRVPLEEGVRNNKQGKFPYYGASGIIDYIDEYIFDGEYILLAEDGANIVLRNSRIAFLATGKFWVNNHAHVLKANGSNYFLCEFLESIKYDKYNTGTAQPKLNAEVCSRIPINIPSLPEQTKIAEFLGVVDEKIKALRQKHGLLKDYKRGIMQKIFTQQIRFKQDDGTNFPDWEEKKLGDVCKITTGESNREDSGIDGKYIFFDRSIDIRKSDFYLFDCEAIIVAGEGKDFIPRYFKGKFGLHQRTYAIMGFNSLLASFAYHYIYFYRNYFLKVAVGSTMPSLRLPMFIEMPIQIPHPDEQQKIADILSSIDNKIDATQSQIDQMTQFKKGLLQQMFV